MLLRFVIVGVFTMAAGLAQSQTIQQLNHQPPDGAGASFQLTDGTVLAPSYQPFHWWVLTPDNTGSYLNGSWKRVGDLQAGYRPGGMASQVLADGRVLLEGGEYNFAKLAFTNQGAIYDPIAKTWTPVSPPKGWQNIGDSPSAVLPNGDFLLGEKFDKRVAELDPATMQWTELPSRKKNDFNAEEGWTLMPDGSVLAVDVKDNPRAERYDAAKGRWMSLGSTMANLQGPPAINGCVRYPAKNMCYFPPGEVGPALLMPNGTVFATGALHSGEKAAHTAIYTPAAGWVAGPDFPNGDQAGDEFASLLPNGHALVEGNSGELYEFDGTSLIPELNVGYGSLMVLPTGEILIDATASGSEIYTSSGTYQTAWQPAISSSPSTVSRGSTYKISGTQFNGLSQANAFGDEIQTSTNYPLVRIANDATQHVFYARTHNPSTMGVATGSTIVSTNFDVPSEMETGASSLVVVANGIPSLPMAVTVQ